LTSPERLRASVRAASCGLSIRKINLLYRPINFNNWTNQFSASILQRESRLSLHNTNCLLNIRRAGSNGLDVKVAVVMPRAKAEIRSAHSSSPSLVISAAASLIPPSAAAIIVITLTATVIKRKPIAGG